MTKPANALRDSRIIRLLKRWDPKEVAKKLTGMYPTITLEIVYHAKRNLVKRQKDRRKQARLYSEERRKNAGD